jgi:CBS-domain-containing membrane protein
MVMPRSILTEKIARRGRHVYREYGVDPLERHFVEDVMTRDVISIPSTLSAHAALQGYFGTGQHHRAYPVVKERRVLGMVDRGTFDALAPESLHQSVTQLLPPENALDFALPSDTCRTVALRLAVSGLERLPVIGDPATRHLVGIVSRSDLLKPARSQHDEEMRRERPFKLPASGP